MEEFSLTAVENCNRLRVGEGGAPSPSLQAGTWWGGKLRLGCWGITPELAVGSSLTQPKIMA